MFQVELQSFWGISACSFLDMEQFTTHQTENAHRIQRDHPFLATYTVHPKTLSWLNNWRLLNEIQTGAALFSEYIYHKKNLLSGNGGHSDTSLPTWMLILSHKLDCTTSTLRNRSIVLGRRKKQPKLLFFEFVIFSQASDFFGTWLIIF